MKRVWICILASFLFQTKVLAIDNEITILAVITGGANITVVENQMDYLPVAW